MCGALIAVASCDAGDQTQPLVAASDAPLLVPVDPRFAQRWKFRAIYSTNNYEVSSNLSLHFDESNDPNSAIAGDEVNDRNGFIDGLRGNIAESWLNSYVTLFEAVDDPENQEVCSNFSEHPLVYRCEIDGRLGDEAETWVYYYRAVRRADGGLTEFVIGDHPGTPDFIIGEFTAVEIKTAAATYLDTE